MGIIDPFTADYNPKPTDSYPSVLRPPIIGISYPSYYLPKPLAAKALRLHFLPMRFRFSVVICSSRKGLPQEVISNGTRSHKTKIQDDPVHSAEFRSTVLGAV